MHGHAGEGREDAHRLDRLPAAPGVHHEQGVFAGPGAVHPGQFPRHPEPGLIEPGYVAGGDLVPDPLGEAVQPPAARPVIAATVPEDSGMPNSSASACAVRFLDRN